MKSSSAPMHWHTKQFNRAAATCLSHRHIIPHLLKRQQGLPSTRVKFHLLETLTWLNRAVQRGKTSVCFCCTHDFTHLCEDSRGSRCCKKPNLLKGKKCQTRRCTQRRRFTLQHGSKISCKPHGLRLTFHTKLQPFRGTANACCYTSEEKLVQQDLSDKKIARY